MKGISRNFIYWGSTLQKNLLVMIGWVFLCIAFMAGGRGGVFQTEFVKVAPSYLIMLLVISVFVNSINNMSGYFPLTVTMGSSRKHSFAAMQAVQHLMVAEILFLDYICVRLAFADEMEKWQYLAPTALGCVFGLLAMGNLISICFVRYGRKIGTFIYMICVVGIIFIVILMGIGQNEFPSFYTEGAIQDFLAKPYILIGGVVLDIVFIRLSYAMAQKQNVQ